MATETLHPTAHSAPASGVSGNAGTGTSTTGTADPAALCNTGAVVTESIEWKTFASPAHQADWSSVVLKIPWSIAARVAIGQAGPGVCCAASSVKLQYTTNGGSSWSTVSGFPKSGTSSSQSGTASVTLSVGVSVSQVRARLVVDVQSDNSCAGDPNIDSPCGCKVSSSVSDVYLQATYSTATGACCNGSTCSVTTEGNCGGTYKGDGVACSPSPCTSGACCNGATCTIKSPANCTGTYKGNNTTCSPTNPCTTNGGCCVGTSCSVITSAACETAGGSYYGDGTTCTAGNEGATCSSGCGAGVCCDGTNRIRSNSCLCADMGVPTRWKVGVVGTAVSACGKSRAMGGS